MTLRALAWLALSVVGGCTSERWACEACLGTDPSVCAVGSGPASVPARTEHDARCSAGEALCERLTDDPARFDEVCRPHRASAMTGCSDAFLAQLRFRCQARRALQLPLPGVR